MKKREDPKKKGSNPAHPGKVTPTFSQKAADKLTKIIGSWTFILLFILYIIFWVLANLYAWLNSWDPYPFILLNLTLSCVAAIQAPIILMSQNRANQKDRQRMDYDYQVDKKSEKKIEEIKKQLDRIERKLNERG